MVYTEVKGFLVFLISRTSFHCWKENWQTFCTSEQNFSDANHRTLPNI